MVYTVSDVNMTVPRRVQVVLIVDGVYEIPSKYFANCHELKHVILPDSIKIIGNFAFDNCRKLEMITLPTDLYSIGKGCFQNCVKLKMMFLPSNLHYLHDSAFKGCSDLQCINLPLKLKQVGHELFFQCTKLEHVSLPQQVICIQDSAFYQCLSLKSITIPSSTTNLEDHCFEDCRSVRCICFTKRSSMQEPIMFGESVFALCINLLQIDFTNSGLTIIGESCLALCHNLRQVKLEKKMNTISGKAFLHCKSIEYIGYDDLPGKICWDNDKFAMDLPYITDIEYSAFEGCLKLKSIKLYRNQNILSHAFSKCKNLNGISLPRYLKLQNNYCDFFSNNRKIEMMEIRSAAKDISYSIAFHVMYEIVNRNKNLLHKPITIDGYRPFEVLIWVLVSEHKYNDRPTDLTITRVIYQFLRDEPNLIPLFECSDMYHALFQ